MLRSIRSGGCGLYGKEGQNRQNDLHSIWTRNLRVTGQQLARMSFALYIIEVVALSLL